MRHLLRTSALVASSFLLSLSLVAPASAGTITNAHMSWYTAQSTFGVPIDYQTLAGDWSLFFVQAPIDAPEWQPAMAEYTQYHTVPAMCDAGTPADPEDDWLGSAGIVIDGLTVEPMISGFSSQLASATAEGSMVLQTYQTDACGYYTLLDGNEVWFAATFTGFGDISRWHDSSHEGLPGDWLSLSSLQSRDRLSTGSLAVGGQDLDFDPTATLLSMHRMNSHESSH